MLYRNKLMKPNRSLRELVLRPDVSGVLITNEQIRLVYAVSKCVLGNNNLMTPWNINVMVIPFSSTGWLGLCQKAQYFLYVIT